MCSCGYSSQRYWTNYSSSNIFPAGKASPGETPQELATRRLNGPPAESVRLFLHRYASFET
ncbi:hypothetical protein E2636_15145 [Paenisporosarcina antarctica]|uniref:Uncharacterized protein n=1 Tax=Paenisporosarcina antarctica TaxID=417367 RepID=A0A4P7A0U3_9BACL|nr:hypothetical protein E2636_15145 [Paenisporosarcina antarctica]